MIFPSIFWAALAASSCTLPAEVEGLTESQYCAFPRDVRAFVRDRADCIYWSGEYPDPQSASDKADVEILKHRAREVEANIARLCKGSDKRLQRLKQRYAKHPEIMQQLLTYNPKIN